MAEETEEFPFPETRVLAIASHVVYGYVGNTMAVFVMQSLGCEVAAINTVQLSNHLGYGSALGTRATAPEITSLYTGLVASHLDDFSMLLSGYLPGAPAVEAVGKIARELKLKYCMEPGRFFWVLDPVMGDNGRLYVEEGVVGAYGGVVKDADLILPNQFEAETLSGVKIVDMDTLKEAITTLHAKYAIPHIIITSISLPSPGAPASFFVAGSTATKGGEPRIFGVQIPAIDCFFSGTGDMFAALMVVRLREAVWGVDGLRDVTSWRSPDNIKPTDLPLARATEKVLASMHEVLERTKEKRDEEMRRWKEKTGGEGDETERRLVGSRAAEVRLVRNVGSLRGPVVRWRAVEV